MTHTAILLTVAAVALVLVLVLWVTDGWVNAQEEGDGDEGP